MDLRSSAVPADWNVMATIITHNMMVDPVFCAQWETFCLRAVPVFFDPRQHTYQELFHFLAEERLGVFCEPEEPPRADQFLPDLDAMPRLSGPKSTLR